VSGFVENDRTTERNSDRKSVQCVSGLDAVFFHLRSIFDFVPLVKSFLFMEGCVSTLFPLFLVLLSLRPGWGRYKKRFESLGGDIARKTVTISGFPAMADSGFSKTWILETGT
jgi:hypothetical protein